MYKAHLETFLLVDNGPQPETTPEPETGYVDPNYNSGNQDNYIPKIPYDVDVLDELPKGEPGTVQGQDQDQGEDNMNVSVWTIYIIVGSVAGGVLLVGLVAIVVALCCNRIEENNGYKHTSV